EAQSLIGHRVYRWRVCPDVRAHHLIIHFVFQQGGSRATLEDPVEPLIAELAEIGERDWVDAIPTHHIKRIAELSDETALTKGMIVRSDHQIVLRVGVGPVMPAGY